MARVYDVVVVLIVAGIIFTQGSTWRHASQTHKVMAEIAERAYACKK